MYILSLLCITGYYNDKNNVLELTAFFKKGCDLAYKNKQITVVF